MPRIGLLSDSHGRARMTDRAVQLLVEQNVDLILHLGDIGAIEVIDALAVTRPGGDQLPVRMVFGNVDWDLTSYTRYAGDLGIQVDHPVGEIALAEGTLVFQHGHDARAMEAAVKCGARYLCHGHTHVQADRRQGSTRIINPGALHRAASYSVAVLDTEADELRFYEVAAP